jgi:hypothetical protein
MNNILNFLKNILSPYESYLIVWVIFLLFSISFTLSGCQSETVKGPESTLPASSPGSADDLLIVDCLLPGKIKKLGRSIVYLEPRRPVRTTGLDCEIRGGEYVAYDRSNYSTALKVWLPKAKEGDMKAQTYVGEIYERGLGIEPDYSLAAKWYQRASEQGYSSAQINLGHLYEKGLGVPQDKVKALYWYRKASDLGEIIDLVPGGEEADRIDQTKLENLKQEIRTLRRKLERTQQELEQTRQKLNQRPEESETEQLTLQQLQQKLAKAQQELETRKREEEADSESVKALKDDYEQLQQKLAKAQQELETRKREEEADSESVKALKDDYEQLHQKLAKAQQELETRKREEEADSESVKALKDDYEQLQQKLTKAQQELETRKREEEADSESVKALKDDYEQLQQKLTKAQQELETRKREEEADSESAKALKDDYEQLRQKLAKTQQELETRKREEEADSESAKALKDDYEQQQKIQHLNQKIAHLEKEAQTYNQQLTALQQKLRNYPKELSIEKKTQKKIRLASRLFGTYHALLIGNNDYMYWDDLNTPKNDATRLANILETKYGFQTKVLINANRYTILDTLNTFREELTEEDNLLVYYAGHGHLEQKTSRGYWIPVDGEKDRDTNWIGTYQITDILQILSSRHVLVIADSCYSGILTRSALTVLKPGMGEEVKKEWIKVMIKKKSRTVLTSGDVAPVLDSGGGGGKHSVFARALIDFLLKNEDIVEGKRLHDEISPWVTAVSLSLMAEQTPLYGPLAQAGHEAGDFFFVPQNGTLSANNMAFTLFSFVFLPEVNKFHIKK